MTTPENSPSILFQKKPWSENSNPIWLASTVSLQRNIEKFKFPAKLESERKKQIITLISQEMLKAEGLDDPQLIPGDRLTAVEKQYFVEHFLSVHGFNQVYAEEGFIIDNSGEFLATINLGDHVHMQMIDCKGELESLWSRLVKIETQIGKTLNYAFLPKFGFLTADPTECGTGLMASTYLQVPGLVHSGIVDEVLDKLADESLVITGIQGNPTEIIGDIIVVQNNYTLGLTEESIISSLRNFITKFIAEENTIRNQLRREESSEFKDKVSRAFGILIHSYQIEAIEALNALSLIKLGVDMGWVKGIDNKQLNVLFFNCRRAHLMSTLGEKINQEDLLHKRAEYIHRVLKDIHLTI